MGKAGALAIAVIMVLTVPALARAPIHIVSLKACTDELLLDLVPPSRIASITFLSRQKASLKRWPQAAAIPVNYGTAEEILKIHPDLVLADPFTPPGLLGLLTKSGVRIVEVPPAQNFNEIRAVTRLVANAVGEQARGEKLIAHMDNVLRDLATHRPKQPLTVAEWGGGGYVPGRSGMFDAILRAIGARNLEQGVFGYYDVESLIAANPEALVYNDIYEGTMSLRADQDLHPALMKRYAGKRVSYNGVYGCGVPESADIARQLQDGLAKIRR